MVAVCWRCCSYAVLLLSYCCPIAVLLQSYYTSHAYLLKLGFRPIETPTYFSNHFFQSFITKRFTSPSKIHFTFIEMDNKNEILEKAVINKGFAVSAKNLTISQSTIPKRLKYFRGIQDMIVNVKSAGSMNRNTFYTEFLKRASLIKVFLFF